MNIQIELDDVLFSVLEDLAAKHSTTIPEEVVSLLVEYLGTPEEIRSLMDDLSLLKQEYSDIRAFSNELESEVSDRIKLLFHLPK
jgi:hypothetical protein